MSTYYRLHKNRILLLLLISFLSMKLQLLAQGNTILPLISYHCEDVPNLLINLHFNEGLNPLCTTNEGSLIYVIKNDSTTLRYLVKDKKGNTLPNFPSKSSNLHKCQVGFKMNCSCIPKICFCEKELKN